jgi:glucose uptake protein GlcU
MLVPAKFAAKLDVCHGTFSGQGFIVSFGIGVAIVTSVIAVIFYIVTRQKPILKPSTMALPAILTGVMWSIGNYGSIFAAQYLGLAVGFSLTQTALLVGGVWGLTLLREIRGVLPIGMWFLSALILLAGSALLAVYGHQN